MCKINKNCTKWDGTCTCMQTQKLSEAPSPLILFLSQQTQVLQNIMEQNQMVLQHLSVLTASIHQSKPCTFNSEGVTSPEILLQFLSGKETGFDYEIRLMSDFPRPAYKERVFSLDCGVFDESDTLQTLPSTLVFKVMLYTEEYPPKALLHTTSGDKILKGTTEIESTGRLSFDKVVIKEVSSHFRNGKLLVAVFAENAPEIKPLIIEDVVVKARKMKNDEVPPSKKLKKD